MVLGNVATVFIGDTDAVIVSTMIFLGMFITFLFAYVGNKVLKIKNMEALILTFAWLIAVMLPFAIWLNTKSGKKWLNSL